MYNLFYLGMKLKLKVKVKVFVQHNLLLQLLNQKGATFIIINIYYYYFVTEKDGGQWIMIM